MQREIAIPKSGFFLFSGTVRNMQNRSKKSLIYFNPDMFQQYSIASLRKPVLR